MLHYLDEIFRQVRGCVVLVECHDSMMCESMMKWNEYQCVIVWYVHHVFRRPLHASTNVMQRQIKVDRCMTHHMHVSRDPTDTRIPYGQATHTHTHTYILVYRRPSVHTSMYIYGTWLKMLNGWNNISTLKLASHQQYHF